MLRLLLLILAVALLAWLLRRALLDRPEGSAGHGIEAGALVACANCGVLLPEGDALAEGSRYYCSKSHALRGPRSE